MAIVQLSPSRSPIHPRAFAGNPRRRAGMGDGTCQIPAPGVAQIYPPCPSNPDDIALPSGVSFQAPSFTPAPACSSSPDPNTSDSPECIAQLLAAQNQNLAANNDANFNFDVQTCRSNLALNNAQRASLGMPALPDTCADNTYGLTPTGGYTGGVSLITPDAPQIVAGSGAPAPVSSNPPTPASTTPSSRTTEMIANRFAQANQTNGGGASSGSGVTSKEMIYAVGGVAALALIFAAIGAMR